MQSDSRGEEAGYFPIGGVHLFTTLHRAADPLARVLLVGSFAHERHTSYMAWVRWARYLAARRIECLRFDYRGIGESTGVFQNMSFDDWLEDVAILGGWLNTQNPALPLILHGLEIGGILAAKAFDAGVGDGLLLWAPPSSANQPLRSTVLRCIAIEQAFNPAEDRRPPAAYIQQLERGECLDVDGYIFSSELWRDSLRMELPNHIVDEARTPSRYARPVRMVRLDRNAAPLVYGATVDYDTIARDFTSLFEDNLEWIASAVATSRLDAS